MDITQYQSLKDNKDAPINMVKVGRIYAIAVQKFDPTNGKELEPDLVTVKRDVALKAIEELEQRMASVKALLADMDALDAK